ncbi:hypothetical protein BH10PLA2_BH10PLA2_12360 [soil metagenome]
MWLRSLGGTVTGGSLVITEVPGNIMGCGVRVVGGKNKSGGKTPHSQLGPLLGLSVAIGEPIYWKT